MDSKDCYSIILVLLHLHHLIRSALKNFLLLFKKKILIMWQATLSAVSIHSNTMELLVSEAAFFRDLFPWQQRL